MKRSKRALCSRFFCIAIVASFRCAEQYASCFALNHQCSKLSLSQSSLLLTSTCLHNSIDSEIADEDIQSKRVYICTNRWCKEKGSGATLSSFVGLAPDEVLVQGVNCLGKCSKGPNLRVRREDNTWLEFNRVNSVQRVYKILKDFLKADANRTAAECLVLNFQGNSHLDKNEIDEAINCYNKALSIGWADQEGVLLVMRATAYLQRANLHKRTLTILLNRVMKDISGIKMLERVLQVATLNPSGAFMVLDRLASYCREKETLYQKTKFQYGLYEIALIRACNDAIKATQLLPDYAKCWLRAGDALAELRKFREAADYYEVAMDLDVKLEESLGPNISWLRSVSSSNGDIDDKVHQTMNSEEKM